MSGKQGTAAKAVSVNETVKMQFYRGCTAARVCLQIQPEQPIRAATSLITLRSSSPL
jgi:hypothetical protein